MNYSIHVKNSNFLGGNKKYNKMPNKVTTTPKLFIGHDIHKRSWKCHFATDISAGATHNMPPNADKLKDYVAKYYANHEVWIAYETGCCGYEPARRFIEFGWQTYVVNPTDIRDL